MAIKTHGTQCVSKFRPKKIGVSKTILFVLILQLLLLVPLAQGAFSPDNSIITVEKSMQPSSKGTVKLTAYDTDNAKMTTGGLEILIKVTNECTKNASGGCTPVASSNKALSTEIVTLMKDNSDGTYTYEFETEATEGKITVATYQLQTLSTLEEVVYLSEDWTGTAYPRNTNTAMSLDQSEMETLTGASSGPLSSIVKFTYTASATASYQLTSSLKG